MFFSKNPKIGIIGLGYVGLPLSVEFGKAFHTIGFDIDAKRIRELGLGKDSTLEITSEELVSAKNLSFVAELESLYDCNTYIVTVPTPIDIYKKPDLNPLKMASKSVGTVLKKGDVVIFESTVYPGATEEVCVPILKEVSGLEYNHDFFVGYSPERINPGDKKFRLLSITKVTSGSTKEVADYVDSLYREIISAGTYKAASIRVAEAAKVIENTQRDVNIALVNELAIIFNRMGLDTLEVLKAAETKWNFIPFRPGLVGGHCIGVDPYYLTHKAEEIGYHPEVILAGRKVNDSMGFYVAKQVVKMMLKKNLTISGARVLVLGLAFKENCTDIRNSRVVDTINELQDFGISVDVFDPWVNPITAKREYDIDIISKPKCGTYKAIILAVAHNCFLDIGSSEIHSYGKKNHVFYDLKAMFPISESDMRL